jgi:hypothetical protein
MIAFRYLGTGLLGPPLDLRQGDDVGVIVDAKQGVAVLTLDVNLSDPLAPTHVFL